MCPNCWTTSPASSESIARSMASSVFHRLGYRLLPGRAAAASTAFDETNSAELDARLMPRGATESDRDVAVGAAFAFAFAFEWATFGSAFGVEAFFGIATNSNREYKYSFELIRSDPISKHALHVRVCQLGCYIVTFVNIGSHLTGSN